MKRFWLSLFAGAMLFSMTGTAQAYLVSVYDTFETDMYLSAGSTMDGIFDLTSALPQNSGYAQPYSVVDATLSFSFKDNSDASMQHGPYVSAYWDGVPYLFSTYHNDTTISYINPTESALISIQGGQNALVSNSLYASGSSTSWSYYNYVLWNEVYSYHQSSFGNTALGDAFFVLGLDGVQYLSENGTLPFSITGNYGDLFFTQARLDVNLVDNTPVSPVPEPSTMLLLGTGLIGLAGFGKRKLSKSKA